MESFDFICAMLQSALPSSCVSRGHLRSAKHGARHDLFSFPCFYQSAPLGARSLLRVFPLRPSLDDLRKTLGGFGSHSLEIFLSELSFKPSSRWPAPAASGPVFQAFRCRAFHPVAVLACREVYQNHPSCQFFSSRFFKGTFHQVCHVTLQYKHYECFRLLSYSPKTTSFF